MECDDKTAMSSDISESTGRQQFLLPPTSDCEIKEKIMYCQSCPYSDVDFGRLRFHAFTQHCFQPAIVSNSFLETGPNCHDVNFFCVKEACSFSTTLCNVYEQHLIHCCSSYQNLSGIEKERLKSTIAFVVDFHNKHYIGPVSEFLNYASIFNLSTNADQDKTRKHLEQDTSSSILCDLPSLSADIKFSITCDNARNSFEFSQSNQDKTHEHLEQDSLPSILCDLSSLSTDIKPSIPCEKVRNNLEFSQSLSVPTPVHLVTKQITELSTLMGQRNTEYIGEQDENNEQLLNTVSCPSSSEKKKMRLSNDQFHSQNVPSQNDTAPARIQRDSNLFLEGTSGTSRYVGANDVVDCNAELKKCGARLTHKRNVKPLMRKGERDEKNASDLSGDSVKNFGLKSNLKKQIGEKPYKCNDCGKSFKNNSHFMIHTRVHTGEKPYKCSECGKSFKVNISLKRHMITHTGEKPYTCNECGKQFTYINTFRMHKRIHTEDKPFKCTECNKCFRVNGNLTRHMRTHTGERPFKCHKCNKSYSWGENLREHLRTHTGEKPYKCIECGKRFLRFGSLTEHSRTHRGDKPYPCDECGKKFTRVRNLAEHLTSHLKRKCNQSMCHDGDLLKQMTGCLAEKLFRRYGYTGKLTGYLKRRVVKAKIFKCKECGKIFSQENVLINHMRTHTGEKPFKCEECGNCFYHKSSLARHIENHQGKKFKCNECGKRFAYRHKLKEHLRTHTGEKPFKCDECGKCFSLKRILTQHMVIHTGDKSYKCNECGKRFLRLGGLTEHSRTHAGDKPYPCDECGKKFTRVRNLAEHLISHLKEKCNQSTGHTGDLLKQMTDGLAEKLFKIYGYTGKLTGYPKKPTVKSKVGLFKCKECGKIFDHQYALDNHMRMHTGEKPFKCEECGKCFCHKIGLEHHRRIHQEKKFNCDECGKRFTFRHKLKEHLRTHTGEKPFTCDECGKCFSRKCVLTQHLATHKGEKPFRCEKCDKGFGLKCNLMEHLRTHREDKPFKCSECGKGYIRRRRFIEHMTKH